MNYKKSLTQSADRKILLKKEKLTTKSGFSNLIENLNLHVTSQTKEDNIFKKKIDKLNLKFYIETEKYLQHKNDYPSEEKCQETLFLILFQQISLYIEEVERLNSHISNLGSSQVNVKDKLDSINQLKKEKHALKKTNHILKRLNFNLEKKLSEYKEQNIKIKRELASMQRQIKFYNERLKYDLLKKKRHDRSLLNNSISKSIRNSSVKSVGRVNKYGKYDCKYDSNVNKSFSSNNSSVNKSISVFGNYNRFRGKNTNQSSKSNNKKESFDFSKYDTMNNDKEVVFNNNSNKPHKYSFSKSRKFQEHGDLNNLNNNNNNNNSNNLNITNNSNNNMTISSLNNNTQTHKKNTKSGYYASSITRQVIEDIYKNNSQSKDNLNSINTNSNNYNNNYRLNTNASYVSQLSNTDDEINLNFNNSLFNDLELMNSTILKKDLSKDFDYNTKVKKIKGFNSNFKDYNKNLGTISPAKDNDVHSKKFGFRSRSRSRNSRMSSVNKLNLHTNYNEYFNNNYTTTTNNNMNMNVNMSIHLQTEYDELFGQVKTKGGNKENKDNKDSNKDKCNDKDKTLKQNSMFNIKGKLSETNIKEIIYKFTSCLDDELAWLENQEKELSNMKSISQMRKNSEKRDETKGKYNSKNTNNNTNNAIINNSTNNYANDAEKGVLTRQTANLKINNIHQKTKSIGDNILWSNSNNNNLLSSNNRNTNNNVSFENSYRPLSRTNVTSLTGVSAKGLSKLSFKSKYK